jgi:ribosomal protein S18 acetylase RimI-like enzyme
MTFISDATFERGHTYLTTAGDAAIAWVPPDLSLLSPDAVARARTILAEHGGEARAEMAFETILAARSHDLAVPHWTLQYLGVRASAQGTGRGQAVVAPMLAVIDAEGLDCGLVSSNPRNVSFYERLGFQVLAEVSTPDGQATLRPMRRHVSA